MGRFYLRRIGGDPLYACLKVAAIEIDTKEGREKLKEIARDFSMEHEKIPGFWLGCVSASIGFVHQKLATLTVKPMGSPEGEAVEFAWSSYGDDDEVFDLALTHETNSEP